MSKFSNPSNKYDLISVAQYCSRKRSSTEKDYVLTILRENKTSKAAGIDRLAGRFLKDDADVLGKPVTDICNLSIYLNKFPNAFNLAKAKPIFKKERKTNASNYQAIFLLPIHSKVIEKVVHKQTTTFSMNINMVLEITIQQTYFYHSSITKFWKVLTTECILA